MKLSHQEVIDRARLHFMSYRDYSILAKRHGHEPLSEKMYANQKDAVELVASEPDKRISKMPPTLTKAPVVKRPKKFAPGSNPSLAELHEAQEQAKLDEFLRMNPSLIEGIAPRWPFPLGEKPPIKKLSPGVRVAWPFRTAEEERIDKANSRFREEIERMIFDSFQANKVLGDPSTNAVDKCVADAKLRGLIDEHGSRYKK